MAERAGSTGAMVSYASEVVVFRPNALSLTLMPVEGPVLNLAASCEEERAEWGDAINRASKFKVRIKIVPLPIQNAHELVMPRAVLLSQTAASQHPPKRPLSLHRAWSL